MYVGMNPIGEMYQIKSAEKLDNGNFVLIFPDDTVFSCDTTGKVSHKPAGTQGAYEQCVIENNIAVFSPDDPTTGKVYNYPFAFVQTNRG